MGDLIVNRKPFPTLKDGILWSSRRARRTMKELHQVPVFFLVIGREKSIQLDHKKLAEIGCDFSQGYHKDLLALLLRDMIKHFSAVQYLHYSESWAVHLEKEDVPKASSKIPPSAHPNRYEIMHYVMETASESLSATQGIIRPYGQNPWLDDELIYDFKSVGGRYASMFTDFDPVENQITNIMDNILKKGSP